MDLNIIIKSLSESQKLELVQLSDRDLNIPKIDFLMNEINKDRPVCCPHCKSTGVLGHGKYKQRKRYKCESCVKTFNDLTGTAMDGIKKVNEFQDYMALMIESVSIREAAKKLA